MQLHKIYFLRYLVSAVLRYFEVLQTGGYKV